MNQIDRFQRRPSDLRRYRSFTHSAKKDWGSVLEFILQNRIHWTDSTPQGLLPFACLSDIKILYNDWPYGIDPRITHLVVWTKFELREDGASTTGDLHPEMRQQISVFVDETFASRVGKDKVRHRVHVYID
jgi:Protein of unknown function (DUF3605)